MEEIQIIQMANEEGSTVLGGQDSRAEIALGN